MRLERLIIRDFRNYERVEVNLSPNINVFWGRNAQGKTNLMEAIYLLAIGRSFRTNNEREIARHGTDSFRLIGNFIGSGGVKLEVDFAYGPEGKTIRQNGVPLRHALDLFGRIKVVVFSPDDLQLLKGAPEKRRSYLDLYMSQIDLRYRHALFNFHRLLAQRNEGLRRVRDGLANRDELGVWNETYVARAVELTERRLRALVVLAPLISSYHQKISEGREEIVLAYELGGQTPIAGAMELREYFLRELSRREGEEIARGLSVVGPHRDDLAIAFVSGYNLRSFGSQGQQRTAALAMKLAAVDFLSGEDGENPIVLLDDVMSEFDDTRRRALLRFLTHDNQTLITATDGREFLPALAVQRAFHVQGGCLTEESP